MHRPEEIDEARRILEEERKSHATVERDHTRKTNYAKFEYLYNEAFNSGSITASGGTIKAEDDSRSNNYGDFFREDSIEYASEHGWAVSYEFESWVVMDLSDGIIDCTKRRHTFTLSRK